MQGEGEAGGDGDSADGASAVTGEDLDDPAGLDLLSRSEFPIVDGGGPEPAGDGALDPPIGGKGGGGRPGSSGDAAGADAAPPLPPPEAPPAEMRKRRNRDAMAVLFVPGGKLTYYFGGRDTNLVAECNNLRHGRCVRTKTLKPPPDRLAAAKKGQGRPLGLLTAWLANGVGLAQKSEHLDKDGGFEPEQGRANCSQRPGQSRWLDRCSLHIGWRGRQRVRRQRAGCRPMRCLAPLAAASSSPAPPTS